VIFEFSDKELEKFPEIYDMARQNWLMDKIYWIVDWRYRTATELVPWLEAQVSNPSPELIEIANQIETGETFDDTSINCLNATIDILTYVGDQSIWDIGEKWQTAQETATRWYIWDSTDNNKLFFVGEGLTPPSKYVNAFRAGDCEDGAILMYVLCRLKGIPANRLYLCAGDVIGGGHCWLSYKPIKYPLNSVFLDWCYSVSSSTISTRNFYTIVNNTVICDTGNSIYIRLWFAFNEKLGVKTMAVKKVT
jgi:hypothetical protein